MAMICAPKRKAVGSNPAGEAKKSPEFRAFFFSCCDRQSRQRVLFFEFTAFLLHCVSNGHIFTLQKVVHFIISLLQSRLFSPQLCAFGSSVHVCRKSTAECSTPGRRGHTPVDSVRRAAASAGYPSCRGMRGSLPPPPPSGRYPPSSGR